MVSSFYSSLIGVMRAVLCAVLALMVLVVRAEADDKGDLGTVIGIDLGTTYSWFVAWMYGVPD